MRPDLNILAKKCHQSAILWWTCPVTQEPIERNPRELLMLAISEIAEAMEGERKDLMDDKLPHRKMAEVEMADFCIRLGDFAGGFGIEIKAPYVQPLYIADNKGDALYCLTASVFDLLDSDPDGWMQGENFGWSIAYAEAYCQKHGYDLWGAVEEKLEFNRTRKDHQPAERLLANGKKF